NNRFYNFAVSPDGKSVAAAVDTQPGIANPVNANHEVQLWDIATGQLMRTLHTLPPAGTKTWVTAIAFAPNGNTLAFGIMDYILLLDPATGKKLGQLEAKMGQVTHLAFGPDNNKLVSSGTDGEVLTWDVSTAKTLYTRKGGLWSIAVSPGGNT